LTHEISRKKPIENKGEREREKEKKRNVVINHAVQLVRMLAVYTYFPKHVKDKPMHENERKSEVALQLPL
jgi:hypothetical protein